MKDDSEIRAVRWAGGSVCLGVTADVEVGKRSGRSGGCYGGLLVYVSAFSNLGSFNSCF